MLLFEKTKKEVSGRLWHLVNHVCLLGSSSLLGEGEDLMMSQNVSLFYQEGPAQPQPGPGPRTILGVAFSGSRGELQTWARSRVTQAMATLPAASKL